MEKTWSINKTVADGNARPLAISLALAPAHAELSVNAYQRSESAVLRIRANEVDAVSISNVNPYLHLRIANLRGARRAIAPAAAPRHVQDAVRAEQTTGSAEAVFCAIKRRALTVRYRY